ncbi:MAG: YoaP domain-containing protein [Erysipelotrichales bacterium]
MEYIEVNESNIDSEHICCAISNSKNDTRVITKKNWMIYNFDNGLKFIKLNERGKVFIEYIPSEKAFSPIIAPNYIFINCFWVSGKYAKQGHGSYLLEKCIVDAKAQNKDGIVVLSSKKKMPFLSDPKFLKAKGFKLCDSVGYFELLYYPLKDNVIIPQFKDANKLLKIEDRGIVIYYSNQCPHAQMYVEEVEQVAIKNDIQFKKIKLKNYKEAQDAPTPFTTYALFDDGKFITNEILSVKKFEKYLEQRKKNDL